MLLKQKLDISGGVGWSSHLSFLSARSHSEDTVISKKVPKAGQFVDFSINTEVVKTKTFGQALLRPSLGVLSDPAALQAQGWRWLASGLKGAQHRSEGRLDLVGASLETVPQGSDSGVHASSRKVGS